MRFADPITVVNGDTLTVCKFTWEARSTITALGVEGCDLIIQDHGFERPACPDEAVLLDMMPRPRPPRTYDDDDEIPYSYDWKYDE